MIRNETTYCVSNDFSTGDDSHSRSSELEVDEYGYDAEEGDVIQYEPDSDIFSIFSCFTSDKFHFLSRIKWRVMFFLLFITMSMSAAIHIFFVDLATALMGSRSKKSIYQLYPEVSFGPQYGRFDERMMESQQISVMQQQQQISEYQFATIPFEKRMQPMNEVEYGQWTGVAMTDEQLATVKQGKIWSWTQPPEPLSSAPTPTIIEESEKDLNQEQNGNRESHVPDEYEGKDVTNIVLPWKPPVLNGYKDVWDPLEKEDNPVFWHIPKAGGSTIKNTLGTCHRFRLATEAGIRDGHEHDEEISIVYPQRVEGQDASPYVNVDPTTIEGLERSKKLHLAESGLAEVIVTPYFQEANDIFPLTHRGRLFTMFRHPVERAISMFYYLQVADWESTYNVKLKDMTLEQFSKSNLVEDNWMVRRLTGALRGKLTDEHLEVAMDVIRRKFLVGLLRDPLRSMERFEKFFRWKFRVNPQNQERCRETLMTKGANKGTNIKAKELDPTDEAVKALTFRNRLDIKLYVYIEELFEQQEAFVHDLHDDFRLHHASCAKCVPPTFPVCQESNLFC